jgi:hypothetical protein
MNVLFELRKLAGCYKEAFHAFHSRTLESISPTFYWRNCANILAQIKSLTFTASTKKLRAKLSCEKMRA